MILVQEEVKNVSLVLANIILIQVVIQYLYVNTVLTTNDAQVPASIAIIKEIVQDAAQHIILNFGLNVYIALLVKYLILV